MKRSGVTRQVSEQLKAAIVKGDYAPGTFLPSEHRLCELTGASRGTVRAALRSLEEAGLVRISPGKGAYALGAVEGHPRLRRFAVMPRGYSLLNAREAVRMLIGICQGAADCRADAIISFQEPTEPEDYVTKYASGQIDGAILIECAIADPIVAAFTKAKVPYVVTNLEHAIPVAACRMDFRAVGRTAAIRLARAGHRHIAALTGRSSTGFYKDLIAGFRGGLAEEDVPLDTFRVAECGSDTEDAREAALTVLRGPGRPTAVFTARDIRAAGVYRACAELGLNVPRDLSIVSYDNITWPQAENAGLTTIREEAEEMGRSAVEFLGRWVASGVRPPDIVFPGEIIERSSVGPPPAAARS